MLPIRRRKPHQIVQTHVQAVSPGNIRLGRHVLEEPEGLGGGEAFVLVPGDHAIQERREHREDWCEMLRGGWAQYLDVWGGVGIPHLELGTEGISHGFYVVREGVVPVFAFG